MPELKEIKYFYEDFHSPKENPILRLLNREGWWRGGYRSLLKSSLKSVLKHPINSIKNYEQLLWNLSYIFRTHDDKWYLSKFPAEHNVLQGDISPQYFFLPSEQIAKIHALIPNAKIIVTLRNPIDWIRSYANMVVRNGHLEKRYNNDLKHWMLKTHEVSSFSKAYKAWIKFFGEEQVEVFYYDRLCDDPWGHYSDICDFLNITPNKEIRSSLGTKVNVGSQNHFDENYVDEVKDLWRDDIFELSSLRSDVPKQWLDDLR